MIGAFAVGPNGPRVGVGDRGIRCDHLHSVETGLMRGTARKEHVVLIELDQTGREVRLPRMSGERPDQIVPLPRAHADCTQRASWRQVQRGAHLLPHEHQALTQPRAGIPVALVPCPPIHAAGDYGRCGRSPPAPARGST